MAVMNAVGNAPAHLNAGAIQEARIGLAGPKLALAPAESQLGVERDDTRDKP